MSASRRRATRRDRRKARASNWQRQPKRMGNHVGHGASGSTAHVGTLTHAQHQDSVSPSVVHPLRVPIADLTRPRKP